MENDLPLETAVPQDEADKASRITAGVQRLLDLGISVEVTKSATDAVRTYQLD